MQKILVIHQFIKYQFYFIQIYNNQKSKYIHIIIYNVFILKKSKIEYLYFKNIKLIIKQKLT